MKTSKCLSVCTLFAVAAATNPLSAQTNYSVVNRGPDFNVMMSPDVEDTNRTHAYVEMATGLNYQDSESGRWLPTVEQISIAPSAGGAAAVQGQHKVYFPGNIYNGVLQVVTPDGRRLSSRPLGVSYDDGNSIAFIAVLKSAVGYLISSNTVIYRDAFDGLRADLICTYQRGGFESDLVMREQPPTPGQFGLDPNASTLQLVTEFFDTQDPVQTVAVEDEEYGLVDNTLKFGWLVMPQGRAFAIATTNSAGTNSVDGIPVYKSWVNLDGRKFLIEEVPLLDLADDLDALPLQAGAASPATNILLAAIPNPFSIHQKHFPPAHEVIANDTNQILLAEADYRREPGVVLDYQSIIISQTNYTFRGDSTYFISGGVNLTGTNTFEGGAVLKYATDASINLMPGTSFPTVRWLGVPYRPVVMTAKDDNSVGETISGSTGNPTNYYANPALNFVATTATNISNLRISHAKQAVTYNSSVGFNSGQVVNCLNGFTASGGGGNIRLRNMLFSNVQTNFNNLCNSCFDIQNSTFCNSAWLMTIANSAYQSSGLALTNCILVNVTNCQTDGPQPGNYYLRGDFNGFYNSLTFGSDQLYTSVYPFQSVGGGNYYLTNGCGFYNRGTTNIDATLLASLRQKTTYPPIVYYTPGVFFGTSLNLNPQAARDSDTPDLGFHYPALDYIFGPTYLTNAAITVNPGTAIGIFTSNSFNYGFAIANNARFDCQGTPDNLNRIVEYNNVQEQTPPGWKEPWYGLVTHFNGTNWQINCNFTDWSVMAQDASHVQIGSLNSPIALKNCQFHGGSIQSWMTSISLSNCLLERVDVGLGPMDSSVSVFGNNTFWGGTFEFWPALENSVIQNNLFDCTTIPEGVPGISYVGGHNAFVANCDQLSPLKAGDLILDNSPAYQSGWLGSYYLPANSPLINAGNTTADQVGLYEFTTQTNQIKETSSLVDVGYHYVATDASGKPIDTYSFGIPDYVVDAAGNGTDTNGLPYWWEGWYFGYVGVNPANDADFDGISNYQEWLNGTDPTLNTNANVNCLNGTIRFWFKPHWTSGHPEEEPYHPRFFTFGTDNGDNWGLKTSATALTDIIEFYSQSNGIYESYFGAPFQFTSNVWCQLTLTYTPTNIAFYTNGGLAATCIRTSSGGYPSGSGWYGNDAGAGVYNYPSETVRSAGFRIGISDTHPPINGEFDEFQTFNYALTAQQVAQGFPGFNGAANVMQDSDYDGRSDLLEALADGTDPTNADDVVPTRLGYWRFNDPANTGEMGQLPLSAVDVGNTPDWSTKSLVISSARDSHLTYRDVETNGWANFNCRKGAVRFWFKPNWSAGSRWWADSPFLSMGITGTTNDFWDLYASSSGNQIGFTLNTPSVNNNFFLVPWSFNISNWCQIVFDYSPTNLALYVNGTLLTNVAVSSWIWPALSSRTNGLTIGNYPSPSYPVNGQFDELETFNYNLDANEIRRSFQAVKSVDSDLNGVADLLEELILTNNVPFMGVPFPVTGVFEAEQFDVGGPTRGYYALDSANATTNYRISALDITNCDDMGGGFCVDKLRVGEWLQYTMDVGVAQTYAVEPRVEGIGTNGVFKIEFSTNGVIYARMTNNLTALGTNWMNVTFKNISLAAGTNVMRVTMLTNGLVNGVSSGYVMRFNYTSIYPSWNEGVTNLATPVTAVLYSNLCDWATANSNAVIIQTAIDQLNTLNPDQGGVVSIPAGTYYVAAREITDESHGVEHNTAEFIYRNNTVVQGAGKTNTILIAQNRAVTIFYIGRRFISTNSIPQSAVTNFTLQDLTLEGSPHWVYDATNTNQRTWEDGALYLPGKPAWPSGCLLYGLGKGRSQPLSNILVSDCLFENSPILDIIFPSLVINFLSISNDFLFRADGTNGGYTGKITKPSGTTANWPENGLGIFVCAGGAVNLNLIACSFNGHVNSTNTDPTGCADGILWCQASYPNPDGNWFAARNTITNYGLEAIQWNSGPAGAVQNRFSTTFSTASTCALCNPVDSFSTGPSGRPTDLSFAFVGNAVVGGQEGVFSANSNTSGETNIANLLKQAPSMSK